MDVGLYSPSSSASHNRSRVGYGRIDAARSTGRWKTRWHCGRAGAGVGARVVCEIGRAAMRGRRCGRWQHLRAVPLSWRVRLSSQLPRLSRPIDLAHRAHGRSSRDSPRLVLHCSASHGGPRSTSGLGSATGARRGFGWLGSGVAQLGLFRVQRGCDSPSGEAESRSVRVASSRL